MKPLTKRKKLEILYHLQAELKKDNFFMCNEIKTVFFIEEPCNTDILEYIQELKQEAPEEIKEKIKLGAINLAWGTIWENTKIEDNCNNNKYMHAYRKQAVENAIKKLK